MLRFLTSRLAVALLLLAAGAISGHALAAPLEPVTAGDLEITGYWAKTMLPGQPSGGGYFTVTNKGGEPDRLISVSSGAAGMVELHKMEIVNDVMTMRPIEGPLEIPAGGSVELEPGGTHLMFMHVSEPFKQGATVAITLEFEKAGKVAIALPVKKSAAE